MQFVNKLCYELQMLITDYEFQSREEFIVYSDGPSREFKNKYITEKILFPLSDKLKRHPVEVFCNFTSYQKAFLIGLEVQ